MQMRLCLVITDRLSPASYEATAGRGVIDHQSSLIWPRKSFLIVPMANYPSADHPLYSRDREVETADMTVKCFTYNVRSLDSAPHNLNPDLGILLDNLVFAPITRRRRIGVKFHFRVDQLPLSALPLLSTANNKQREIE